MRIKSIILKDPLSDQNSEFLIIVRLKKKSYFLKKLPEDSTSNTCGHPIFILKLLFQINQFFLLTLSFTHNQNALNK